MVDVLIKAGSFVAIILLGYVLRKINFFKEGDFQVLSKIVLKISLPAALVSSLANKEIDPSLLFISLLGHWHWYHRKESRRSIDKAGDSTYNSLYSNKGNKRRREEVAGSQSQTESSRPVKGAWEDLVNTSRSFAPNGKPSRLQRSWRTL